MLADAEIVAITSDFFAKVGIDVVVKINNRKVLDGIMADAKVPKNKWVDAILTLDKLEKVGEKEVLKEFVEKGIDGVKILKLVRSRKLKGCEELEDLERYLSLLGVKNYQIDYSLARGLSYYTGTVFEVVCKEFSGSVAGGGRYDKMIGDFLGKGEYPAMGISFGLEPIFEILKKGGKKTVTELYVIPIKCLDECLGLVQELRGKGVKVDLDMKGRSVSKNLDYANKMGVPFALIVGSDELKSKKFNLKNMVTGKEKKLSVSNVVKELK